MDRIWKLLEAPEFWFANVAVALLVNLLSDQVKAGLQRIFSGTGRPGLIAREATTESPDALTALRQLLWALRLAKWGFAIAGFILLRYAGFSNHMGFFVAVAIGLWMGHMDDRIKTAKRKIKTMTVPISPP